MRLLAEVKYVRTEAPVEIIGLQELSVVAKAFLD
jgi:hypothetical protein